MLKGSKIILLTYFRKLVPNLLNLLPLLPNYGSVKTLFNDHVLCTLILLQNTASIKESESRVAKQPRFSTLKIS